LKENIHVLKEVESREGILELPWCGKEECGIKMEEELDMKSLGTPLPEKECNEKCAICKEKATTWLRLAKTY